MRHILLLGAGFSRNWGGWLASEAFEYLLGCPQVDKGIRELLWRYRRQGGFEDALAHLQTEFTQKPNESTAQNLAKLEGAIQKMFTDMDEAFAGIDFEFQKRMAISVRWFLTRFDAIFTVNQDLLMERHYLIDSLGMLLSPTRTGWEIPGMRPLPIKNANEIPQWTPLNPGEFAVSTDHQPYFKLHGSSNWIDKTNGRPLLVMGGNKPSAIRQHPILKWNQERFTEYLSKADTRLMVIGYSFGDDHINRAIGDAVDRGTLRLFIIDPLGLDVLDKNRHAAIYVPDNFFAKVQPHLIGAARRSMGEIFGGDLVEDGK